jgi:hypothetical protein
MMIAAAIPKLFNLLINRSMHEDLRNFPTVPNLVVLHAFEASC